MWNACPTHPAGPTPLSNRTQTAAEVDAGEVFLRRLIDLLEPDLICAVGKTAARRLGGAPAIRHPANGGATECATGIATIAVRLGLDPRVKESL